MLTRGYFIGEIIDDLSNIEGQLRTRAKLGLTDLHRHSEDFFKEVLNKAFSFSLINKNTERTNAPGIDLVDETNGVAFQVTAEKTTSKVNDTLSRISNEDFALYPNIYILMIGGKQNTYAPNNELWATRNFKVENIWDIHVICKKLMELPVDTLQSIHEYVKSEFIRIKIELEIPDAEGRYPTNLSDIIEAIPTPQLSDFANFNNFLMENGLEEAIEETVAKFTDLSKRLSRIPRITREFLATLVERREDSTNRGRLGRTDCIEINYDIVERIASRYRDREGEIRILEDNRFLIIDEPENKGESAFITIFITPTDSEYDMCILNFLQEKSIPLGKVLINLNFADM